MIFKSTIFELLNYASCSDYLFYYYLMLIRFSIKSRHFFSQNVFIINFLTLSFSKRLLMCWIFRNSDWSGVRKSLNWLTTLFHHGTSHGTSDWTSLSSALPAPLLAHVLVYIGSRKFVNFNLIVFSPTAFSIFFLFASLKVFNKSACFSVCLLLILHLTATPMSLA